LAVTYSHPLLENKFFL